MTSGGMNNARSDVLMPLVFNTNEPGRPVSDRRGPEKPLDFVHWVSAYRVSGFRKSMAVKPPSA